MTNLEKLKMMQKQFDSTQSDKARTDLLKGMHRLEKKMKQEKLGMSFKDGIYYKIGGREWL